MCTQWPKAQVQAYILKHLATLHLDLYKTDPTVKETVNVFVGVNDIKGTFRKLVFSSVMKKKELTPFARKILDNPPQDVLATFALMREIAAPLVDASTSRPRGSDTGFWTGVEEALETLYSKHGQDRKSPGWLGLRLLLRITPVTPVAMRRIMPTAALRLTKAWVYPLRPATTTSPRYMVLIEM
ncbi:hypothetical protein B0H17DRAFT_1135995 [Mycena rosella]|uniref:Uncharacterized protein n=1 Tax=Mycena rosella TaxID=1033263 RepID=A0AAD7DEV1_MYCRO|nr:hypothetical protein B0H17DRAFT_1135995 [Mycena rosella]